MATYLRGDRSEPRGHALLFFRHADNPDEVWATYLIITPVALDLAKYIPSAFAAQIPTPPATQDAVAYPLPPMPEKVDGGLPWLERMATLRHDDLLDGGSIRPNDLWQVMQPVAEAGRVYAEEFRAYLATASLPDATAELAHVSSDDLDVDALLLQVLPAREKIARLARLVGTLQYALDGGDEELAGDTVAEMSRVGRSLEEKYWAADFIKTAQGVADEERRLTQLYIERCYRLADEDYAALAELDRKISTLRAEINPPS